MNRLTTYDEFGEVWIDYNQCVNGSRDVLNKLAYYENLEEQGYEMVNINKIIAKLESHFMAEENILNMGGYLDAIKVVKDEVENGKTD